MPPRDLAAALAGLDSEQTNIANWKVADGNLRVVAPAGSGKCVGGDTIIPTESGCMRIEHARRAGSVVGTIDAVTLQVTESAVSSQWLAMGVAPTRRIQTETGIYLDITLEHPLLVWASDGSAHWKRGADLCVGDVLLVVPGYAQTCGTATLAPDEAYLVGLFIGNGCWSHREGKLVGLQFSTGYPEISGIYCDLAERFWGKRPKGYKSTGRTALNWPIMDVQIATEVSASFPGMVGASARDKYVPPAVMYGTPSIRVAFLQGLFDTDAGISERGFEWSSASERLAREVHQLLIGLGVVGRLKPKKVKNQSQRVMDHTYWRLLLSGEYLRIFRDLIGFRVSAYKQEALDALCAKEVNPNQGVYPYVGRLLRALAPEWGSRWNAHDRKLDGVRICDYLRQHRSPSRSRLLALIEGCRSESAHKLRNLTRFYPDPIKVISEGPTIEVYDYHVPATHSFVANGIVSHNTTSLITLIARLIADGEVDPADIYLTTFANKAGKELARRLGDLTSVVPERIGTFHALALKRLCKPSKFPPPAHRWAFAQCLDSDGSTRGSQIPTSAILWRCATEFGKMPGTGKPSLKCAKSTEEANAYVRYAELCRSRLLTTGHDFAALFPDQKPPQDFDEAWALVREAKTALRAWDFTDALECYADRLQQSAEYDSARLVAVDEAQDQSQLLLTIAERLYKNGGADARILMIGDLSQAIYSFMGAAPEIFATADQRFGAKTIYLVKNYRSVPDIVALGNAITTGKDWKLGPDATSVRKAPSDSVTISAIVAPPGGDSIGTRVAEDINYRMRVKGAVAGDFAILTRTNAALLTYQGALVAADIPHVLVGTQSLFSQREIVTFISWLLLVQGHGDIGALEHAVRTPNRFLGKDFIAEVGSRIATGFPLVKSIEDAGDSFGGATQRNAYKLADDLNRLIALSWDALPDGVLDMLLKATKATTKDKDKAGGSPDEDKPGLFKAACAVFKKFGDSLDAVDFIDRCTAMAGREDDGFGESRVTLATVHKYKGREIRQLYLDTSGGSFPSSRSTPRELEEERRIFYVAVTRAMDGLTFAVADQPAEFAIRYVTPTLRSAGWEGKGAKK